MGLNVHRTNRVERSEGISNGAAEKGLEAGSIVREDSARFSNLHLVHKNYKNMRKKF